MRKFIMFILTTGLLFPSINSASLSPWRQVGAFVEQKLTAIASAVTGENLAGYEWPLDSIWVRVQAPMGIEVPWAAQLRVVPEIEVILQPDDKK